MKIRLDKATVRKTAIDIIGIVIGAIIMALALVLFLLPHRLAAGGISGLSVILFHMFKIPVGITILAFNIPLFIASYYVLGRRSIIPGLIGTVVFSVASDVLAIYLPQAATQDILLAAVYGGIITGIGTGIVFRYRGSTGGTTIVSLILNRLLGVSTGQGLLVSDLTIISLSIFSFGGETAMYAALSLFIGTYVVDLIQEGLGLAKAVLIITGRGTRVAERVLQELGRGVTRLNGQGAYTGKPRELLLCVVSRLQVTQIKEIVQESDPEAFFIIGNANEVHGEGFHRHAP